MMRTWTKVLAVTTAALTLAGSAFAGEVDRRENVQQERVAQGVRSGQLTGRETRQIERREMRTEREIARDRALHHGRLTAAERRHINREENRTSRVIYRDKHNGCVR